MRLSKFLRLASTATMVAVAMLSVFLFSCKQPTDDKKGGEGNTDDATLKTLVIKQGADTVKNFSAPVDTTLSVTLTKKISTTDKLRLEATTTDASAKVYFDTVVEASKTKEYTQSVKKVVIKVEKGTATKEYTLNITEPSTPTPQDDATLKTLVIKQGVDTVKNFSAPVDTTLSVTLTKKISTTDKLRLEATTTDASAKVYFDTVVEASKTKEYTQSVKKVVIKVEKGTATKEYTLNITEQGDPSLTLSYLKVFEEVATDLNAPSFNVANDITDVPAEKVIAKFNYGDKTDEQIAVAVAYKEGTSLKLGANKLTLSVAAVEGKHKDWSEEITVTRAKGKVVLTPISLKVKTSTTPLKWEFATKNGNDFVMEVPTSIASISQADIEAYFEWDGMQNPKPRKLDFSVEGNFPIQLEAPGTAKEIKMTVPEDANGEYSAFTNKLTITRKKAEEIKLLKIKLVSKTFTKKEITDLNTPATSIPTNAQDVNVFFYSKADATQEDAELLKKITTEPELQKNGNVKTWKLDNLNNELKVKVDGTVVYTVKVTRNPLLVDSIQVYDGGNTITEDAEEGQTYTTTADKITIAVMPKQLNSGYLIYKSVTVKAGSATEVSLPQNDPADPTQGFSGVINLTDESTQITVTIKDPTDNEDFTFNRTFTINRTTNSSDPTTGPIDPSVQIAELWIGDGTMDKENTNKFKAVKDSSDEHKYTVNVLKTGNSNKYLALMVNGVTEAQTADVKDMGGTNSVKANGTKFVSTKKFSDIKGNSNKYLFLLENGDKKAVYEVTVEFTIEVLYTITVNQPENGQIKVYRIVSNNGVRERVDLEIGADNTLKVNSYAIYFELIANNGKTPKNLILNGKPTKGPTQVEKQTPGAIAKMIFTVTKDYTVTGECGD